MVAMDANFRLKNQLVSTWSRDPGMGIGTAYFVGRTGFEQYIKSRISEDDVSCGLLAICRSLTCIYRLALALALPC